jgi:hypothetical protein
MSSRDEASKLVGPAAAQMDALTQAIGGKLATSVSVQTFTASGTWNKPAGAALVRVPDLGRRRRRWWRTSGSRVHGSLWWCRRRRRRLCRCHMIDAADLAASVSVIVGAGGLGGNGAFRLERSKRLHWGATSFGLANHFRRRRWSGWHRWLRQRRRCRWLQRFGGTTGSNATGGIGGWVSGGFGATGGAGTNLTSGGGGGGCSAAGSAFTGGAGSGMSGPGGGAGRLPDGQCPCRRGGPVRAIYHASSRWGCWRWGWWNLF